MGRPRRPRAASTRRSVSGLANENNSEMATASAPLPRISLTRVSNSSSVGERRISPSALTRSGTPKRSGRGTRHTGKGTNQS